MNFDSLSKEGKELAISTVAFSVGRWAAAKALGDINREIKAASEGIDGYNTVRGEEREDELEAEVTESQGNTPRVSFSEYCHVLGAANDALEMIANGAKWPRAQAPESILDWLSQQKAAPVRDSDIEAMQALISAHTGGKSVDDATAKALAEQSATDKAAYFAATFAENREQILQRMRASLEDYARHSDASFETLFSNLPARVQLGLLNSIDRKIDFKCDELLTGQRNGKASQSARIPILARGAMIAELRGDQKTIAKVQSGMAHASDLLAA